MKNIRKYFIYAAIILVIGGGITWYTLSQNAKPASPGSTTSSSSTPAGNPGSSPAPADGDKKIIEEENGEAGKDKNTKKYYDLNGKEITEEEFKASLTPEQWEEYKNHSPLGPKDQEKYDIGNKDSKLEGSH